MTPMGFLLASQMCPTLFLCQPDYLFREVFMIGVKLCPCIYKPKTRIRIWPHLTEFDVLYPSNIPNPEQYVKTTSETTENSYVCLKMPKVTSLS